MGRQRVGGEASKRLPWVAGCAVLIALVASCAINAPDTSIDGQESQDEHLSSYGARAEFDETVQSLEWPVGVTTPVWNQGDDPNMNYGKGTGEIDALMVWNCVWGREWLLLHDSGKDSEAQARALETFVSFADKEGFRLYFAEDLQEFVSDYFDKAKLGDPAPARKDLELNCIEGYAPSDPVK